MNLEEAIIAAVITAVVALLGWLAKRSVDSLDAGIKNATDVATETSRAVGELVNRFDTLPMKFTPHAECTLKMADMEEKINVAHQRIDNHISEAAHAS